MRIFLSICGIIASFLLLKYRERVGENLGEAEWMAKVGGIYGVVIIIAILLFFWSVAELTNTTDFLFAPVLLLFPHATPQPTGF